MGCRGHVPTEPLPPTTRSSRARARGRSRQGMRQILLEGPRTLSPLPRLLPFPGRGLREWAPGPLPSSTGTAQPAGAEPASALPEGSGMADGGSWARCRPSLGRCHLSGLPWGSGLLWQLPLSHWCTVPPAAQEPEAWARPLTWTGLTGPRCPRSPDRNARGAAVRGLKGRGGVICIQWPEQHPPGEVCSWVHRHLPITVRTQSVMASMTPMLVTVLPWAPRTHAC